MTRKEAEIIQDLKIIKKLLYDIYSKTTDDDFFINDAIHEIEKSIDSLNYAMGE